jgi:hypothetical protein
MIWPDQVRSDDFMTLVWGTFYRTQCVYRMVATHPGKIAADLCADFSLATASAL